MSHRRLLGATVAALLAAGAAPALASSVGVSDLGPEPALALPSELPGLGQLAERTGSTTGIASLSTVPTASTVDALEGLGLQVQPMHRLPLAIVRGPVDAMRAAVATGLADDVYPDESIELLDTASSDAMGAAVTRAAGLTGEGVTVAVVDSGCDASHPDLADHITHNVKLVSAEYANIPPDSSNTIVVPMEAGPYQNTDLGSGHGTHVAGIIAADGEVEHDLLSELLAHDYFARKPPKSTGREQFGAAFIERVIEGGRRRSLTAADMLALHLHCRLCQRPTNRDAS